VTNADCNSSKQGLAYGIAAYGLWGLVPLYFRAVSHVSPLEVLAHRAAWSFVVLAALLSLTGKWNELARVVRNRRAALMLAASTLMIAVNWLTVIYAVSTGQILQASLGYYLAPLVNAPLGVLFLGERLGRWQKAALLLAAGGVAIPTIALGTVPWIALVLAASFSLYGFLRKTVPAGALVGLSLETMLLAPVAVAYLLVAGQVHPIGAPGDFGLLALSGLVTSIPLLLFAAAARRLRLATLGFVQYLSPSVSFLLAVFAFGEPFGAGQLAAFLCIWIAVVLYAVNVRGESASPKAESPAVQRGPAPSTPTFAPAATCPST
jgi:chloramphenicol-sensitive protein RarD